MLNGQIAFVTGASRGIGKAIALELGKQGAVVLGTATSQLGAEQISAYLAEAGIKGEGLVLEVREAAQVDAVLGGIEKQYGAPTILVNNAGITRDNLAMRMKDDEWDAVIDTNLKAVFRLCKAVMRGMMKARQGRIINVTSVVGHAGNPGQANYCAAKAGVAGLSRSLARELGSRNITVNCVASRKTSLRRLLFLPRRAQPMSQALRCMSTAACTWIDARKGSGRFGPVRPLVQLAPVFW